MDFEETHELSGCQQQKVQLGVTIMNDPGLLILREPGNAPAKGSEAYATEGSRALIAKGFTEFGVQRVVAFSRSEWEPNPAAAGR